MSTSRQLWVIGSDTDEYQITTSEIDRSHILSSTIKRYDSAVVDAVNAFLEGTLESGEVVLGLDDDAVGLSRSGDYLKDIDGFLKNLDAEIAFGHVNVFGHSLVGPLWQRNPDVTIRLDMTDTSCMVETDGDSEMLDGRVRVERGTVVMFEYINRTDGVGGVSLRTVPPGVSLADLNEEAKVGIPASFGDMLAISFVEPGATTSVAAVMAGSAFVPNCFVFDGTDADVDFPAVIVSPGV
jgi:hypothetical protein